MTAVNVYDFIVLTILVCGFLGITAFILLKSQKQFKDDINRQFQEYKDYQNRYIEEIKDMIKNTTAKQVSEKIYEKNLMSNFAKLRSSIKDNCTSMMHKVNATRIAVYLFHNGTSSSHGITFFKISCICEKIKAGSGIKERSIEHSNIPINLFDTMIDQLDTNGRFVIINNNSDSSTNHNIFISSSKIKYSQAVSIFDSSNNLLGFVLVEMDHDYDRDTALQEKNTIDTLVSQLAPIFSYHISNINYKKEDE